jgi:hypothetical protein
MCTQEEKMAKMIQERLSSWEKGQEVKQMATNMNGILQQ